MYILIPGFRNSDEHHWQSIWERNNPTLFLRIQQENWDEPDCKKWTEQIELTLTPYPKEELILIGHSIGCMAIVHWLHQYNHKVKGVLLVAPSDPERPGYPSYISGFSPIPLSPITCPGIVVASSNDHVTSPDRSAFLHKNGTVNSLCWKKPDILTVKMDLVTGKMG